MASLQQKNTDWDSAMLSHELLSFWISVLDCSPTYWPGYKVIRWFWDVGPKAFLCFVIPTHTHFCWHRSRVDSLDPNMGIHAAFPHMAIVPFPQTLSPAVSAEEFHLLWAMLVFFSFYFFFLCFIFEDAKALTGDMIWQHLLIGEIFTRHILCTV